MSLEVRIMKIQVQIVSKNVMGRIINTKAVEKKLNNILRSSSKTLAWANIVHIHNNIMWDWQYLT